MTMHPLIKQTHKLVTTNINFTIENQYFDPDGESAMYEVVFSDQRDGTIIKAIYKDHLISVVVDPDDFDISAMVFDKYYEQVAQRIPVSYTRFPMDHDEVMDAVEEITQDAIDLINKVTRLN